MLRQGLARFQILSVSVAAFTENRSLANTDPAGGEFYLSKEIIPPVVDRLDDHEINVSEIFQQDLM